MEKVPELEPQWREPLPLAGLSASVLRQRVDTEGARLLQAGTADEAEPTIERETLTEYESVFAGFRLLSATSPSSRTSARTLRWRSPQGPRSTVTDRVRLVLLHVLANDLFRSAPVGYRIGIFGFS